MSQKVGILTLEEQRKLDKWQRVLDPNGLSDRQKKQIRRRNRRNKKKNNKKRLQIVYHETFKVWIKNHFPELFCFLTITSLYNFGLVCKQFNTLVHRYMEQADSFICDFNKNTDYELVNWFLNILESRNFVTQNLQLDITDLYVNPNDVTYYSVVNIFIYFNKVVIRKKYDISFDYIYILEKFQKKKMIFKNCFLERISINPYPLAQFGEVVFDNCVINKVNYEPYSTMKKNLKKIIIKNCQISKTSLRLLIEKLTYLEEIIIEGMSHVTYSLVELITGKPWLKKVSFIRCPKLKKNALLLFKNMNVEVITEDCPLLQ